jgi:hypothetical protein
MQNVQWAAKQKQSLAKGIAVDWSAFERSAKRNGFEGSVNIQQEYFRYGIQSVIRV